MPKEPQWTKQAYDSSVTSECWWYTPYDKEAGGYWEAVSADEQMKQIAAMEQSLPGVPDWARRVGIGYLPPCGHYMFPEPLLQVASLIGSGSPEAVDKTLKHQCYTVGSDRKKTVMDYCLCLDAWLAGAPPEAAARELTACGHRKIDWQAVCRDLWDVLGEPTEKKRLLVELALHAVRHAVKSYRWDDDDGSRFCRDEYLGDFRTRGGGASRRLLQGSSPRVRRIKARLSEIDPGWAKFSQVDYEAWWLCAPKAFRFLERDLWAIGEGRRPEAGEQVPGLLRCEDTYPNQDEAAEWYRAFCGALDRWWRGKQAAGGVAGEVNRRLGESSPVKRWLVRLLLKKLRTYERHGGTIGSLVNPKPHQKRGTRPIQTP